FSVFKYLFCPHRYPGLEAIDNVLACLEGFAAGGSRYRDNDGHFGGFERAYAMAYCPTEQRPLVSSFIDDLAYFRNGHGLVRLVFQPHHVFSMGGGPHGSNKDVYCTGAQAGGSIDDLLYIDWLFGDLDHGFDGLS